MMLPPEDQLLRIGVAALCGAGIGLERELRGQLAGMRTYALVAAGSAIFTIAGAYGFPELTRGFTVDPMRVAAQIVSGIGFIGAGVILREGGAVRGVTTAAAIWASAAIGMAAGAGQFAMTAFGFLTILATLVGLRIVRDRGLGRYASGRHEIDVRYERGHGTLAPVVQALEQADVNIERLSIDDESDERRVQLSVRGRNAAYLRDGLRDITERPEVRELRVTDQRGERELLRFRAKEQTWH